LARPAPGRAAAAPPHEPRPGRLPLASRMVDPAAGSPTEVEVHPLEPERFREVLSDEEFADFEEKRDSARELMDGRVLWNVNSTAKGGGVAEMLASLLAYAAGSGVDARWLVVGGDPDFFRVTK